MRYGEKQRIFISGVHGVGKTSFSKVFFEKNYAFYSCSTLIKMISNREYREKIVDKIDENQDLLILAIEKFVLESKVIFDGHFCLFDTSKNPYSLDYNVFEKMNLDEIIFLEATPEVIQQRIVCRDNQTWMTIDDIAILQNLERSLSEEYANRIGCAYTTYIWKEDTYEWGKVEK